MTTTSTPAPAPAPGGDDKPTPRGAGPRTPRSIRLWGEKLADKGAHLAGEPFAQFAALIAAIVWIAAGGSLNALSVALSIAAITLTQLVLNQQRRRETALHIKIDELIRPKPARAASLPGLRTCRRGSWRSCAAGTAASGDPSRRGSTKNGRPGGSGRRSIGGASGRG